LVFVFGVSGSGKTFYCLDQVAKNNGFHLHLDCLNDKAFDVIDDALKTKVDCNVFYVDGLLPVLFKDAVKKYKDFVVKCVVLVLPVYVLNHTQTIRDRKKLSDLKLFDFYVGLFDCLSFFRNVKVFDSMLESEFSVKENFAVTVLRKSVSDKVFLKKDILDRIVLTYGSLEKNYHDIFLGNETIKGCTPAEQTWNIIKENCDFKGKIVVDVGPCTGYFLHKAWLEGAECLVGYEIDRQRRDLARLIMRFNELPVWILNKDVCKENIFFVRDKEFDVWFFRDYTFVLNVYHWFKDKNRALENIFTNTVSVVFELNDGHIDEVVDFADLHGFVLRKSVVGRINRHVLFFDRWDKL
jgi:hypothetical protein